MNKIQETIKNKCLDYSNRHADLSHNFKILYEELTNELGRPLTLAFLHDMQNKVDCFLKDNNLDIDVAACYFKNKLFFIGETFIDELVWNALQNGIN